MNESILARLLDTGERILPGINRSVDDELLYEFFVEKLISILIKRLTGVSGSGFVVTDDMSLKINDSSLDGESVISDYYSRFIEEQSCIYSKLIDKLGECVQLYKLDPLPSSFSFGTDEGEEAVETEPIDSLELFAMINKVEDDIHAFGQAYPNIKTFLDELYRHVAMYGEDTDNPMYCIYLIKSLEMASLIENRAKEPLLVQMALDAFCNIFGNVVIDGTYWGYYAAGDARGGYYDDDTPMIFNASEVGSIIVLYNRIKEIKERR